jgi:hypothetical protein
MISNKILREDTIPIGWWKGRTLKKKILVENFDVYSLTRFFEDNSLFPVIES